MLVISISSQRQAGIPAQPGTNKRSNADSVTMLCVEPTNNVPLLLVPYRA
jgi:hypothetical protein